MASTVFKAYVMLTVLCICMTLVNKSQSSGLGGCIGCIKTEDDEKSGDDGEKNDKKSKKEKAEAKKAAKQEEERIKSEEKAYNTDRIMGNWDTKDSKDNHWMGNWSGEHK